MRTVKEIVGAAIGRVAFQANAFSTYTKREFDRNDMGLTAARYALQDIATEGDAGEVMKALAAVGAPADIENYADRVATRRKTKELEDVI